MSDLGFDVRGYCERLAKACDRFTFKSHDSFWILADDQTIINADDQPYPAQIWSTEGVREAWRFFGPLADERKIEDIRPWDIVTKRSDHRFPTLLEEIIAAVVESFESEVKKP